MTFLPENCRRALLCLALALSIPAVALAAEPIDNCASLLGSISVELRFARALPHSQRTTFVCPRDTRALLGASRQRVLNSLGTPDLSGPVADGASVTRWSYFFVGTGAGERGPGIPELGFSFNDRQEVSAVTCQLTR